MCSSLSVTTPTHSHCPRLGVAMVGVEWTLPNAGRKPRDAFECVTGFSPSAEPLLPQYLNGRLDSWPPHVSSCFPLLPFLSRLPLHPCLSYWLDFPKGNIECGPAQASQLLRMSPLRHRSSPMHSAKLNRGREYSLILHAAWTF